MSQIKQMLEYINTFDILFYYNSNCIQYIVNLFIILGKCFIHKCKFLGKNPVLSILLVDYNKCIIFYNK